jgi:hypothetical protein
MSIKVLANPTSSSKMKCEGPQYAPCKRCRNAKVNCVFETAVSRGSRPSSTNEPQDQ